VAAQPPQKLPTPPLFEKRFHECARASTLFTGIIADELTQGGTMASWDVHSIEQADQRLKEWVGEAAGGPAGGFSCSMGAPLNKAAGQGVNCYLLDIHETSYLSQANQLPLQLTLRYLVTTWGDSPEAAHLLLGRLITQAINEPQLETEFQPVPLELWRGLQILPQPCFFIRMLVRLERARPKEAPLVRKPLVVEMEPVVSLSGRVVGPENMSIMDALVEMPFLNLSTRTDAGGEFHFYAIPGGSALKTYLNIRARGQTQVIQLDRFYSDLDPLIIRFDFST
jgi:hypothetical protein